jgi:hypothetical protein
VWLLFLTGAAFGVAWLSGTRLHIRKPWYIALLASMTAVFAVGYVAWLGVGIRHALTARWGWGLLTATIVGALLIGPAAHQPIDRPLRGRQRSLALVWEGLVYGVAEGVLLSALPPFMAWQLVQALGWNGAFGAFARWGLPVLAAATVIVIHHLGYWNCRNRILVPITLALSVLTASFLLTGSWLAPALAHVVLHTTLVVRGSEMPPQDRPLVADAHKGVELVHVA